MGLRFFCIFSIAIFTTSFNTTCITTIPEIRDITREGSNCDSSNLMPQLVKIPAFYKTWQMVENCNLYDGKRVSTTLMIFYTMWLDYFNDPKDAVINNLNEILIHWSSEDKRGTGYDLNGTKYENAQYGGLTLSPGYVWVKTGEEDKLICGTSLIHELVHASIWAIKETDADPDHAGTKYSGWTDMHTTFIMNVNKALCILEI